MNVPQTAADVLRDHVTLECESIDRLYFGKCVCAAFAECWRGGGVSAWVQGAAFRLDGSGGADDGGVSEVGR